MFGHRVASLAGEETDRRRSRLECRGPAEIPQHLPVIVLANNRRVDVSLSTTGQQSVRRYPFNAKNALGLISPKGVEKEPGANPRPKKK
jgi:hypothetical protein